MCHLVVYQFHCKKLFDVVFFSESNMFACLRNLVWIFSNLIFFLLVKLKIIFGLRLQVYFKLKLFVYVSNFDEVACLLVQVLYLKLG